MEKRLLFKKGFQNKFLINFKQDLNLSEKALSEKFKFSRRAIRSWINEERTLPQYIFYLILKEDPKLKSYNKYIIKTLDLNWGNVVGGKKRYNQLKNQGKFEDHHNLMIKNKLAKITSERIYLSKKSDYFNYLNKNNIPIKPLLQTMLFTDGYLNEKKNIISFTSKSLELINIFYDFLVFLSKNQPRVLLRKNGIYEIYLYDKDLTKSLLSLSPTYKTGLNCNPSLKFLFKQNEKTIIECFRLAMTTDGCVILGQEHKIPFKVRGRLSFSCAHEKLLKEWKNLFNLIGFNGNIVYYESKCLGLVITKSVYLTKFYELGGFIENVKISGKSPRFEGYNKNEVLKISLNTSHFKSWNNVMKELNALGS
ncbi:MAG: hypothetical protein PHF86_13405 [Candidatus Nanoarchaeia archaeon]|nr:hypothetical protein [Candidatus Nanoarchaeia archaeon]